MYQVKTETFSGPLEKLLEMIEGKKMDITRISLAEVTADFIFYVKSLESEINNFEGNIDEEKKTESLRMLADFLTVASQLILIKSKALLPELILSQEEESEINNLEARLKIYSQLKPMFALTKKYWIQSNQLHSRTMLMSIEPFFYPPKEMKSEVLKSALDKILNSLGSFFLDTEKIKKQLFSLEDKIAELTKKIKSGISKFSQMIDNKNKEEVIVMFLALLHLLRDNIFVASQNDAFEEISIENNSNLS